MRKLLILLLFSIAILYQNCADVSVAPVRRLASCTDESCAPGASNALTNFYNIDVYAIQNTSNSNCEIKLRLYDGETDTTDTFDLGEFPILGRPFCDVRSRVLETPTASIKRVVVSLFGGFDANKKPILPTNTLVAEINLNQKSITSVNSNFSATSPDAIVYQPTGQILMEGASAGYCDSDGYEDFYMSVVAVVPPTSEQRSAVVCVLGQSLSTTYRTLSTQPLAQLEAFTMLENITQDTLSGGFPHEVVFKSQGLNDFFVLRGANATNVALFSLDSGEEARALTTMKDFNNDGLTEFLVWGINSTGIFIDTFRSEAGIFVQNVSMNSFIAGFVGPFFGKFKGSDPFQAIFKEPTGGYIYTAVGVGSMGNQSLISQSTLDSLFEVPGSILYTQSLSDLNGDGYSEVFFEKQENQNGILVTHKFIVDVRSQVLLARFTQNSSGSFSETKEIFLKGQ